MLNNDPTSMRTDMYWNFYDTSWYAISKALNQEESSYQVTKCFLPQIGNINFRQEKTTAKYSSLEQLRQRGLEIEEQYKDSNPETIDEWGISIFKEPFDYKIRSKREEL